MFNQLSSQFAGSKITLASQNCLPPENFQRVLMRERMRSDRSGVAFSLVVISPRANRLAVFQQLEGSLTTRLRETDVAGYLNDEQLALLLLDTDHDGAQALSAAVVADCEPIDNLELRVYVYPALPEQLRGPDSACPA